eukprot:3763-Chlamydomonas_euryale.AAC.3
MDGTLTVPCIDFAEMKRRAGVPANADILDTIESWEDVARREAAYAGVGGGRCGQVGAGIPADPNILDTVESWEDVARRINAQKSTGCSYILDKNQHSNTLESSVLIEAFSLALPINR